MCLEWFAGDPGARSGRARGTRAGSGDCTAPTGALGGCPSRALAPSAQHARARWLDIGPAPVDGGPDTLATPAPGSLPSPPRAAPISHGGRFRQPDRLQAVQNIGNSGQPGSPHYADQFEPWLAGSYHSVSLNRADVEQDLEGTTILEPDGWDSTVRILAGPPAHAALLRGVDRMARLLRPTLGPLSRTVAITRLTGLSQTEILDNGAVIARRTIQLADPFEDMGAARSIRHLAWRVFEQSGRRNRDSRRAGAVAHALGMRYIAAGGDTRCRCGARDATRAGRGDAELHRQARTIDGPTRNRARCDRGQSVHGRSDLADMIGEVVDAVGTDGAILVEDAQGMHTTHEYIDGVRWNEGYVSSFLLRSDEASMSRMLNPRVLVTDYALDKAEQLVPALEACVGPATEACSSSPRRCATPQ